jgi:chaperonin GroES
MDYNTQTQPGPQLPDADETQQGGDPESTSKGATLDFKTLQSDENLAEKLDEETLKDIGTKAVDRYNTDKESRAEWEKKTDEALKLALQVMETKNYPWPNASNIKFPLLTIASLQFSARVYPALIKAPDLAKYRIVGPDPMGQKASKADRIGKYISYQLLEEQENWEEEQDKLFIALPVLGTVFKKTYYDPVTSKVCSCLVLPTDLVCHYYTKDLDSSPHTHYFELYPREIKERQLRKIYLDVDLGSASSLKADKSPVPDKRQGLSEPSPDDRTPRPLLESYDYLDLDGDGYEEPYIITVDYDSTKVLRIKNRFGEVVSQQSIQGESLRKQAFLLAQSLPQPQQLKQMPPEQQQQIIQQVPQIQAKIKSIEQQLQQLAQQPPDIIKIVPRSIFTKYSFIPSPDGGFYELGFGQLLAPINSSVNTIINQLVDLGTLQNGNSGFIGKGARFKGGAMRFNPFEWKQIQVAGSTLKESIVPLPVNQPSAVMFQLLGMLVQYAERIGSVSEIMQGENPGQNTPAYNMQAMLQQGLQVFNGVFKRIYRSFRGELRKIYALNGQYLDPEVYATIEGVQYQILKDDFSGDSKDLIPAADPNSFSNMEAVMKAQFLATRSATIPGYNVPMVEKRLLQAMDIPDTEEIYPLKPDGSLAIPPPPNPETEIDKADMQRRTLEGKARAEKEAAVAHADIELKQAQAVQIMHDIGSAKQEAMTEAQKQQHDLAMKKMEMIMSKMEFVNEQRLAQMDLLIKQMEVAVAEKKADIEMKLQDKKMEVASKVADTKVDVANAQASAKKKEAKNPSPSK